MIHPLTSPTGRAARVTTLLAAAALTLSACAGAAGAQPSKAGSGGSGSAGSAGGSGLDTSPQQSARVTGPKDDTAAALVPAAIRDRGTLVVGGGYGAGTPPLGFYADDATTPIGIEVDVAHLVADKLGLAPKVEVTSWENLFLGLDSGAYDVGFSNITVTQKRKEKYDFATYRKDDVTFEAKKGAGWKVTSGKDIAGRTIAVGSGTNQEKLLLDWDEANAAAGLPKASIRYYQNASDTYLALASGRIDAYFAPNPAVAYHVATGGQTEAIGTFSGAGASLQGLIAATTKKGNGLAPALRAALNSAIADGTYAKTLQRWKLADEAVPRSELNPPGLPLTD